VADRHRGGVGLARGDDEPDDEGEDGQDAQAGLHDFPSAVRDDRNLNGDERRLRPTNRDHGSTLGASRPPPRRGVPVAAWEACAGW